MRIFTKAGDLAFSTFNFPDGQPHFRLETYEKDFDSVTIETRIASPSDLFDVQMAVDVLRQQGFNTINLNVRYLMGARMDRAINSYCPFTLQLVARTINALGFNRVRILDVHSPIATNLIRHSENVLPTDLLWTVRQTLQHPIIVCPDKGAQGRVEEMCGTWPIAYAEKNRNPQTGQLSGFNLAYPTYVRDKDCLIVDDICDGGGTFIGLTEVLKRAKARNVFLFVTHGIFSKGTQDMLKAGITKIYTTNSFRDDQSGLAGVVTIPIQM